MRNHERPARLPRTRSAIPRTTATTSAPGGGAPPPPPPRRRPRRRRRRRPTPPRPVARRLPRRPPPPPPPPGGYARTAAAAGSMPPPPRSGGLAVGDAFGYGWSGFKANLGPILTIAAVLVVVSLLSYFIQLARRFVHRVQPVLAGVRGRERVGRDGSDQGDRAQILDGEHPTLDKIINGDVFVPFLIASVLVYIGTTVGLLLCIIPGLIFGFLMMFYGYALVDGTTQDPVESMRVSYGLTSKNVGSLIVLVLRRDPAQPARRLPVRHRAAGDRPRHLHRHRLRLADADRRADRTARR